MTAAAVVGYDPLRDVRHKDAKSARDQADWLAWLELGGEKARDFALWAQAVRAWHSSRWDLMRDCRLAIQATRAFSSEEAEFVVDDPQMEFAC